MNKLRLAILITFRLSTSLSQFYCDFIPCDKDSQNSATDPPGSLTSSVAGAFSTLFGCSRTTVKTATKIGLQHNYGLDVTHDELNQHIPTGFDNYLELITYQAKNICDGEKACLESLDFVKSEALGYVYHEGNIDNSTFNRKRRLSDIFPKHGFRDNLIDALELVLIHISYSNEDDVMNELNGLHLEINENGTRFDLTEDERTTVATVISVAKSSTEYWHEAFRSGTNRFRHLQILKVFDCVFQGKPFNEYDSSEDRQGGRKLRSRLSTTKGLESMNKKHKVRKEEMFGKERQIRTSKGKQIDLHHHNDLYNFDYYHGKYGNDDYYDYNMNFDDFLHECLHCKDWHHCSHCYGSNYGNGQIYPSQYNPYAFYNPGIPPDPNFPLGYGPNANFFDPTAPIPPPQHPQGAQGGDSGPSDVVVHESNAGIFGLLGDSVFNIFFIVRADVIGAILGVVLGRGCLTPTVASAFIFSSIYAVCYRATSGTNPLGFVEGVLP